MGRSLCLKFEEVTLVDRIGCWGPLIFSAITNGTISALNLTGNNSAPFVEQARFLDDERIFREKAGGEDSMVS